MKKRIAWKVFKDIDERQSSRQTMCDPMPDSRYRKSTLESAVYFVRTAMHRAWRAGSYLEGEMVIWPGGLRHRRRWP